MTTTLNKDHVILTFAEIETMKIGALKTWLTDKNLTLEEKTDLAELFEKDSRAAVNALGVKLQKEVQGHNQEIERLRVLYSYERDYWAKGFRYIAGIDEAGRGPLVGPVVTAAVVFTEEILIMGLDDSKKLSEAKREALYDEIMEKAAAVSVGIADHQVIDTINILNATKKAMTEAVQSLAVQADYLLLDAVKLDVLSNNQLSLIKGDQKSASIAAASIIAKVTRDRLMAKVDLEYPQYGFGKHKGYGTAEHVAALKMHGPCPYHRKSFIKNFVEL